jgi:hypothetical protein
MCVCNLCVCTREEDSLSEISLCLFSVMIFVIKSEFFRECVFLDDFPSLLCLHTSEFLSQFDTETLNIVTPNNAVVTW